MKANDFMRKHGFQYTRNLVRDYPNHTHVTDDGRMFINENTCASHIKVQLNELVKIDELKRLVESHELVRSLNGLIGAKANIREVFEDYPHDYMSRKLYDFDVKCCAASKAIADVESSQ